MISARIEEKKPGLLIVNRCLLLLGLSLSVFILSPHKLCLAKIVRDEQGGGGFNFRRSYNVCPLKFKPHSSQFRILCRMPASHIVYDILSRFFLGNMLLKQADYVGLVSKTFGICYQL